MKLLYLHLHRLNVEKANSTQVVAMCDAFASHGVSVTLAIALPKHLPSDSDVSTLVADEYGITGEFTIRDFGLRWNKQSLDQWFNRGAVRALVAEIEPDICFVRSPILFRHCVGLGQRTLFESHHAMLHSNRLVDAVLKRSLIRSLRSSPGGSMVTISSALERHWVAAGVPASKVIALHDGFSARAYEPELDRVAARESLGLKSTGKLVVYAGSLYADRGMENIIHAARSFPEVSFLVIGGPAHVAADLQSLARGKRIANIEFAGRVKHRDVPRYLFAADVLLALWSSKVATINYCSPLKLFEYMAAARPIVAHDFPTIREVLEDGVTALLATPDSPAALVEKLGIALEQDELNPMGRRAREVCFQNYSWNRRAERLLDFHATL